MIKFLFIVLSFTAVAIATENAAAPELTSHFIASEHLNDLGFYTNYILSNPHLRKFYKNYYSRPQEEQLEKIKKETKRVEKMTSKANQHHYPYHDQFSMNPNTIADIVNYQNSKQLIDANTEITRSEQNSKKNYDAFVSKETSKLENLKKNSANTAKTVDSIYSSILSSTAKLRDDPEHTYSSPFSSGSSLSKIADTIRDYEHRVKRPLAPLAPNQGEIDALNRLREKMAEISKRIHQKPLENLHQDAHAQDLMLDRLANLIRRMSNAVSDDHQDGFLQQLHMMLHAHHLHDHRFMSSLESEIAYALAHGQALPMPRDYQPTYQTAAKAQEVTNPLHVSYSGNMAAQSAANVQSIKNGQQPMYSNMWGTKPSTPLTTVNTPGAQAQSASTSDPNQALQVAQQMRQYGKTLINRSKEMKHRADIIERRETIPSQERQDLMNHIQNRLVNPPAEVHPVGAQRPVPHPSP